MITMTISTSSLLFNQHKLVAELKQKDKDIQTMIAEQRDTLTALSRKDKEIEALKDRMARLHKLSELED